MAKAITSSIKITSRASVKVGNSFYTVEYSEERIIPPDIEDLNIQEERKDLWDTCNCEVDLQIEEILKLAKK